MINFSANEITELDEHLFRECVDLEEIDFTNNKIKGLNKNIFNILINLREIHFNI